MASATALAAVQIPRESVFHRLKNTVVQLILGICSHCLNQTLESFRAAHCKGKAVPLQAWSGPEGSRKLRFPDYMTTAQDGGKAISFTHRPPLSPGNVPGTHFC
jgi:hypothetical protein